MEKKEEENLVDDKYINLGFKGKGSFSKVYLVKDNTNNQEYALRVLKKIVLPSKKK